MKAGAKAPSEGGRCRWARRWAKGLGYEKAIEIKDRGSAKRDREEKIVEKRKKRNALFFPL